ncbi:amidohydrolase [Marinobacterium sp. YM272]|uniref:amidohydrolase n=1 Tax=Marinobacterium sp. YM272 TaxID=3421654 RepID=UPI003D7F6FE8
MNTLNIGLQWNELDEQLVEAITGNADKVWEYAEVGFEEFKSSNTLVEWIESEGFEITERNIAGIDTSWVASFGSGSPVIGILTEYDALPDLGNEAVPSETPRKDGTTSGHGCGHNLIGTGAIGGAVALKRRMEKAGITGTLRVYGCPAEELLAGKNYMAKAGVFDDLDACLHWHPMNMNTTFNIATVASADLKVEWHGKNAHAGGAPWEGRSALHASELFTHGINTMREHIVPEARMHYYVENGGSAVNVIPDKSSIVFRYRGPNAADVQKNLDWIRDIAKGAALMTQTKVDITEMAACYDVLPNQVLSDRVYSHLEQFQVPEWTEEEQAFARNLQREAGYPEDGMATDMTADFRGASMGGSTDVGDISYITPTMGVLVAAWPLHVQPHHWGATASNGMSLGHKAAVKAAQVLAATGLDLLTDPDLLEAATEEFKQRTGGKPYKSMCTAEAHPIIRQRHAQAGDGSCGCIADILGKG